MSLQMVRQGPLAPSANSSAVFTSPYDADVHLWDYGFVLRRTDTGHIRAVVRSDGAWEVSTFLSGQECCLELESGVILTGVPFHIMAGQQNHLRFVAAGRYSYFDINGVPASLPINLGALTNGDVAVATGLFIGDERAGAVTAYEDFMVWEHN